MECSRQKRPEAPKCSCCADRDSTIAKLKRDKEILRREIAAWRDRYPGYKYHADTGGFSFHGMMEFLG